MSPGSVWMLSSLSIIAPKVLAAPSGGFEPEEFADPSVIPSKVECLILFSLVVMLVVRVSVHVGFSVSEVSSSLGELLDAWAVRMVLSWN